MLDFVGVPPCNQAHDVAVGFSVVLKVRKGAMINADPIDGESHQKDSQLCTREKMLMVVFHAPQQEPL